MLETATPSATTMTRRVDKLCHRDQACACDERGLASSLPLSNTLYLHDPTPVSLSSCSTTDILGRSLQRFWPLARDATLRAQGRAADVGWLDSYSECLFRDQPENATLRTVSSATLRNNRQEMAKYGFLAYWRTWKGRNVAPKVTSCANARCGRDMLWTQPDWTGWATARQPQPG